jgi:predicted NUDIX family NTP pyrophosphohydrolase
VPVVSAGILLFRTSDRGVEVLLVHPGGPFWRRKDLGAWTIPKGEVQPGEDLLDAARREFHEETGWPAEGEVISLGQVRQASRKVVHGWAVEGEFDPSAINSNTFEMEWPPRSGQMTAFPEADKAAWFGIDEARRRILPAQAPLLDALLLHLQGRD